MRAWWHRFRGRHWRDELAAARLARAALKPYACGHVNPTAVLCHVCGPSNFAKFHRAGVLDPEFMGQLWRSWQPPAAQPVPLTYGGF
jgi:hypothetical protein